MQKIRVKKEEYTNPSIFALPDLNRLLSEKIKMIS
jgi:hypothetical protein